MKPFRECHTVLLSAGPRFGKSTLLYDWFDQAASPALYLQLVAEDARPSFFLKRFLENCGLSDMLPAGIDPDAGWGAAIGQLLTNERPELCLLLDDFHAIEGTALEPELLALIRHFPLKGTLAIASRHRFPTLQRPHRLLDGNAHDGMEERPEVQDLLSLPEDLLASALALYLQESAPPSAAGWELHRRCLADLQPDRRLRFRSSWEPAAQMALTHPLAATVWTRVEEELEAGLFEASCHRHPIPLLDRAQRLPPAVRQSRAVFLAAEGFRALHQSQFPEAEAHLKMALERLRPGSPLEPDLRISLASLALSRGLPAPDLAELLAQLPTAGGLRRARLFNLLAYQRNVSADPEGALTAWQEVLKTPALGHVAIGKEQQSAARNLVSLLTDLRRSGEAARYAEQDIALIREHGLHENLLGAYALQCENAATSPCDLLDRLVAIPDDAFAAPSPWSQVFLLVAFAVRARRVRAWDYFDGILALLADLARQAGSPALEEEVAIEQLIAAVLQRRPFPIERYQQLRSHAAKQRPDRHRLLVAMAWAKYMHDAGRHEAAQEALGELRAHRFAPDEVPAFELFASLLQPEAVGGPRPTAAEIRELLGPTPFGEICRELAEELVPGLMRPQVQIRAFGRFSVGTHLKTADTWIRRRAQVMLAHLVRVRQGLDSGELAACLIGDASAGESLHTAAYNVRKSLASVGLAGLIESRRGGYRIAWSQVDFFDLEEFDRLLAKARRLREAGYHGGAALLARIALLLARGPVMEDLTDDMATLAAHYEAEVAEARSLAAAGDSPAS